MHVSIRLNCHKSSQSALVDYFFHTSAPLSVRNTTCIFTGIMEAACTNKPDAELVRSESSSISVQEDKHMFGASTFSGVHVEKIRSCESDLASTSSGTVSQHSDTQYNNSTRYSSGTTKRKRTGFHFHAAEISPAIAAENRWKKLGATEMAKLMLSEYDIRWNSLSHAERQRYEDRAKRFYASGSITAPSITKASEQNIAFKAGGGGSSPVDNPGNIRSSSIQAITSSSSLLHSAHFKESNEIIPGGVRKPPARETRVDESRKNAKKNTAGNPKHVDGLTGYDLYMDDVTSSAVERGVTCWDNANKKHHNSLAEAFNLEMHSRLSTEVPNRGLPKTKRCKKNNGGALESKRVPKKTLTKPVLLSETGKRFKSPSGWDIFNKEQKGVSKKEVTRLWANLDKNDKEPYFRKAVELKKQKLESLVEQKEDQERMQKMASTLPSSSTEGLERSLAMKKVNEVGVSTLLNLATDFFRSSQNDRTFSSEPEPVGENSTILSYREVGEHSGWRQEGSAEEFAANEAVI